jgi:hypothetical protein
VFLSVPKFRFVQLRTRDRPVRLAAGPQRLPSDEFGRYTTVK